MTVARRPFPADAAPEATQPAQRSLATRAKPQGVVPPEGHQRSAGGRGRRRRIGAVSWLQRLRGKRVCDALVLAVGLPSIDPEKLVQISPK